MARQGLGTWDRGRVILGVIWLEARVVKGSEIPGYIASKPLARMRKLASALGWHGIQLCACHACGIDETPTPETPIFITYQTSDEKFNLQINESPMGQSKTYLATVKAERYGILYTEWIDFELPDDDEAFIRLIQRLRPLLHRQNYKDRTSLREIKATGRVRLLGSTKKQRGKRRGGAK